MSQVSGSAMRRWCAIICVVTALLVLAGCATSQQSSSEQSTARSYQQISQDEAARMMESNDGHVVLDVRRQDEYDSGHIPGALLIPNELIGDTRPEELPDLQQVILVYCRSGNRSKQAAQKLADMGYANVYEFGGINTWQGPIVTEPAEAKEPTAADEPANSV